MNYELIQTSYMGRNNDLIWAFKIKTKHLFQMISVVFQLCKDSQAVKAPCKGFSHWCPSVYSVIPNGENVHIDEATNVLTPTNDTGMHT